MPERPVAKIEVFKILDLILININMCSVFNQQVIVDYKLQVNKTEPPI